jgi:hypothetical protein
VGDEILFCQGTREQKYCEQFQEFQFLKKNITEMKNEKIPN